MLRRAASVLALVLAVGGLAACAGAPAPSGPSCAGTAAGAVIARDFAPLGAGNVAHAEFIAYRESRCAFNDADINPIPVGGCGPFINHAYGTFQELMPCHADWLAAVCPFEPWYLTAQLTECNVAAAERQVALAGWGPWGG